MRILSLYFRVFFWTGFPFGLLTGAYNALMIAPLKGLVIGLWAGAAFGALMSLILVSIHWMFISDLKNDPDYDPGSVRQKKAVTLNMMVEQAYERSIRTLETIGPCEILTEDKDNGCISAQTPGSMKSFGEIMDIELKDAGSEKTSLTVQSRPTTRTTLVDFGKGMENLHRFIHEVAGAEES